MTKQKFTTTTVPIDECGSWNQGKYFIDKKSADALNMAFFTGRPLLVKGEPGLGKSYLALAAANHLQCAFLAEVINSNTEAQDLLWRDDPVARLNDAQFMTAEEKKAHKEKKENPLHPKKYINPGVLWWAYDWHGADEYYKDTCVHKIYKPVTVSEDKQAEGIVLLIDEIDKADPSVPNSLLEVMGNSGFEIPIAETVVGKKSDKDQKNSPKPLVIITTNDERELPPAFVRRCLVLHLEVDEANIETWLMERAKVHVSDDECCPAIKLEAARQLKKERAEADKAGVVKAGMAEYLDLLKALVEMTNDEKDDQQREEAQSKLLNDIKEFALKKGKA